MLGGRGGSEVSRRVSIILLAIVIVLSMSGIMISARTRPRSQGMQSLVLADIDGTLIKVKAESDTRPVTATISDERGVRSMEFPESLPDPNKDGEVVGSLALSCDDECNAAFALGCFALCGWAGFTPGGALCAVVCALGAANSCRCICHNIGCPPPPTPPECGSIGLPDCD